MQAKGAKFTANPKLVLTAGHAACECTRRVSVTFCYMMRNVKLRHRRDKSAGVGPANVTSRFRREGNVWVLDAFISVEAENAIANSAHAAINTAVRPISLANAENGFLQVHRAAKALNTPSQSTA